MCGRYYVDDETAREIEKLVRDLDRKLQIERTGDVFPAQNATIIKGQEHHLAAEQMRWGFPGFEKGKLLINARAESALERRDLSGQCAAQALHHSGHGAFTNGTRARRSSLLIRAEGRYRCFLWRVAIIDMRMRKAICDPDNGGEPFRGAGPQPDAADPGAGGGGGLGAG